MPDTLAQRVRAKYVGAYDDLTDQELEAKVTAKFPGVYDDLPRSGVAPEPTDRSWTNTAVDVAKGAGKGAVETISNLGTLARRIPGVSSLDRLVTPMEVNVTP